jgi:hypothetical protein
MCNCAIAFIIERGSILLGINSAQRQLASFERTLVWTIGVRDWTTTRRVAFPGLGEGDFRRVAARDSVKAQSGCWKYMRQLTAILSLLQFLLLAGAPLLAADTESNLPACCRRSGKHHCMGRMPAMLNEGASLRAANTNCPAFPKLATAPNCSRFAVPGTSNEPNGIESTQPSILGQIDNSYHICWSRIKQKRGPPTQLS